MDIDGMARRLAALTGSEVFIHRIEGDQQISEGTSGTVHKKQYLETQMVTH